jgi:hypothetical protein
MTTQNMASNDDPRLCPLCHQHNECGNLIPVTDNCWCRDPEITFPKELLAQLPASAKHKACICRACVLAYLEQKKQGLLE